MCLTIINGVDKYIQCVHTWFGNYASGHAKESRPAKGKSETCGHLTSSKTWTTKAACGHLHMDRISKKQKSLSNNGEKDIGKYHSTLAHVFDALTDAKLQECEDITVEWNTKDLLDEIQHK